jgi:PPOX class probable F420-dependent enzyme
VIPALLADSRVARLSTVDPSGAPHLVPVTFAVSGGDIAIAVDHKPKTTRALARLRNIAHEPRVSLLADHYDEDWTQLWWVRLDGTAQLRTGPAMTPHLDALAAKYPQYREVRPEGPVILITPTRIRTWSP